MKIPLDKIIHHSLPKFFFKINNFIWYSQLLRHVFGNTNLAAGSRLPRHFLFAFVLPELQRHPMHFIALLDEKHRRYRTIDSPAHSQENPLFHLVPFLPPRLICHCSGQLRFFRTGRLPHLTATVEADPLFDDK